MFFNISFSLFSLLQVCFRQSLTRRVFFTDSNFYQGPVSSGGFTGPPPGSNMGIMSTCSSSVAPQTQPLPSNVLGKGGDRNLDQQYMQQSSQIFVFSTDWANRSAQAVMSQEYLSIISWHESQPETKKQLDVSQFLKDMVDFGRHQYVFLGNDSTISPNGQNNNEPAKYENEPNE